MAKPNYAFEKRQRELEKKRKKEEKAAERAARKAAGIVEVDSPAAQAAEGGQPVEATPPAGPSGT